MQKCGFPYPLGPCPPFQCPMSSSCEVRPRRLSRQILALFVLGVERKRSQSAWAAGAGSGVHRISFCPSIRCPSLPSVIQHSAVTFTFTTFACISLSHSPALSLSLLLSQRHRVYINDWRLAHRCRVLDAPLRAINFRTHQASILAHALHTWQEQPRSHRTKQQPLYIHQNVCNGSLR